MRKFIVDQVTGIVKFETAIPYQLSEGEILVETDDRSTLTFTEIKVIPHSVISPAKFYLGLDKQGVTEIDVLFFIENYIENVDVKREARILFQKATEFEYGHELLNQFIPLFNQYLISKERTPISLEQIFLT